MSCFLVINLLGALVIIAVYGIDSYKSISGGLDLASINLQLIKWLQITLSIGIFALPPIIFSYLKGENVFHFLRLRKPPGLRTILMTALIVTLASPLVYWFLEVNQNLSLPDFLRPLESYFKEMEERNEELMKMLLHMDSISSFALNFFMIAMVPAFVEELLFRGTLQRLLQGLYKGPHLAIFLTGAFFSFIHFQFYGFLPRMVLGVLFGYLFYWSGNLWVPILAHFIHNGTQVVMLYLYKTNVVELDIEQIETVPPMLVMVSTVVLFATLYLFDRFSQEQELEAQSNGKGVD